MSSDSEMQCTVSGATSASPKEPHWASCAGRYVKYKKNKIVLVARPGKNVQEREKTHFVYLFLRDATSYETPSSHNFTTTTRIDNHWMEVVGIR